MLILKRVFPAREYSFRESSFNFSVLSVLSWTQRSMDGSTRFTPDMRYPSVSLCSLSSPVNVLGKPVLKDRIAVSYKIIRYESSTLK